MTPAVEMETAILRTMTPARKLEIMQGLWRLAWDLKTAAFRRQHPEWTSEQVSAKVRETFRSAVS